MKKRYVFPGADLNDEQNIAPPPKMGGAAKPKETSWPTNRYASSFVGE